ncbi:serine/threonine-protein kinase TOR isoform X2 [Tanacetum coccineum]
MQHPKPNNNFVSQPLFHTNYLQRPMQNPGDISNPTTAFNMALALMAKAFTLNDTTLTNNNQRSSSNPSSMQIAQLGMNMDQDRQMLMVEDNVGNQFRQNAMQNVGNQVVLNASPESGVQNVRNQMGLVCYNCQGEGHYASNCTVKPRKQDAAYLQKQMHIAQKEEAGIQLTSKEFDFMACYSGLKETKIGKLECTLENNFVEQGGGTVEQHPANVEETRAYFESLYNNLVTEVEKVNLVNRKMKETNADLTTELARYKNQEKSTQRNTEVEVMGKVLFEKHDPPAVHDSEETMQLAQESFLDVAASSHDESRFKTSCSIHKD